MPHRFFFPGKFIKNIPLKFRLHANPRILDRDHTVALPVLTGNPDRVAVLRVFLGIVNENTDEWRTGEG